MKLNSEVSGVPECESHPHTLSKWGCDTPSNLTHHLQGDDELSNLGTPTPKELTFDDLKELYIVASRATNKFFSLGM
jgi:hypothetical protein